jgi:hypothetical protein
MIDQDDRLAILDDEHLRLLSIGYYISGGLSLLFALIGFLYMAVIGIFIFGMSRSPIFTTGEPPPQFVGYVFAIIGFAFLLFVIFMSILKFVSGSHLKKRKSRILCMIVAGVNCLEFPYGTLLSIFTFLVLSRSSVKKLFMEPGTQPPHLQHQEDRQ